MKAREKLGRGVHVMGKNEGKEKYDNKHCIRRGIMGNKSITIIMDWNGNDEYLRKNQEKIVKQGNLN